MDLAYTLLFPVFAGIVALGLLFVSKRIRTLEKKEDVQRKFSQQLLLSQEDERKRIAGELHDSLGQELLALKSRLEILGIKHSIPQADFDDISEHMTSTIERTRNLSHELRPPHLERFGLSSSLTTLAQHVSEDSGIPIHTQIQDTRLNLSAETRIALFRIAQEALVNMVKHSDTGEARLNLKKTGNTIRLSISDDGRGFDLQKADRRINIMKERAKLIGAKYSCDSTAGQGTRITVDVKTA